MILLIFAHRPEAQEFFRQISLRPVPFPFQGLYESNDFLILITGEGVQNVTQKLSATLAAFVKISKVINFGIAGYSCTKKEIPLHTIVKIRTCYCEHNKKMEFHSFSCDREESPLKEIDCVTTSQRVLSKDYAYFLSHFAPLVDRECWAVGSVCKMFQTPFFSYKLISDYIDDINDAEKKQFCESIREQSHIYSSLLYKFYTSHTFSKVVEKVVLPYENLLNNIKKIHFTLTQERQLKKLLRNLSLKEISEAQIAKSINWNKVNKIDGPKKKAAEILDNLNKFVTPFYSKVREEIEKVTKDLKSSGASVKLSQELVNDNIRVSAILKNHNDFKRLSMALESFPYLEFKNIISGKIDVQ
jgi:nucleoside phosphorylase